MPYAQPQIETGAKVNYSVGTDIFPGTVISRTDKRLTIRTDSAELLNGANSGESDALTMHSGGFCAHTEGTQRYSFDEDPNGRTLTYTLRKNGIWVLKGGNPKDPSYRLREGWARYHDYNF